MSKLWLDGAVAGHSSAFYDHDDELDSAMRPAGGHAQARLAALLRANQTEPGALSTGGCTAGARGPTRTGEGRHLKVGHVVFVAGGEDDEVGNPDGVVRLLGPLPVAP